MKKIIFIITLLLSTTLQANENWTCTKDSENFIAFYPFDGYWAIVTNKPIKAAKRATNGQGTGINYTSANVQQLPSGSRAYLFASEAIEHNLVVYIEPLCYAL
jgi:hypothetical protein